MQPDPFQAPPQSVLIGAPNAIPMTATSPYGQIVAGGGRPAQMMSFSDSIRSVIGHSLTFDGRASRSEYWWFQLVMTLSSFGIWVVLFGVIEARIIDEDVLLGGLCFLGFLGLLLIPASLSVIVRRLHDQGKSGWWVLITFIPYIGSLILLVFMLIEGEELPNMYGPPPTNTLM